MPKQNTSVPNYLSDIRDEPFRWSEWSDKDSKFIYRAIPLGQEINSLDDLVFGKVAFLNDDQTKVEYHKLHLNTYIDRLPHGIIDKQQAGIGATTLEIMCDRHSVIVVPTKFLAYNKAQKHNHCLYVGSSMKGRPTTKASEIEAYLNNDTVKFKKILVVADSLKKVVDVLEAKEVKDDFFLMIDEIDLMQEDSNYRPSLENVMDYYFEFPPKNRCLISATIKDFSDPRLRGEIKFTLNFIKPPKRNILLTITNNINEVTKRRIEQISAQDKVFIAYNSVTNINIVIEMLPEELREECAILCSEASIKEAKHYYRVLNEDSSLPSRINFATCCYFTGIDIDDTYHLITVSGTERSFQSLSLNRIEQIAGRCRISNGIKSETIIYSLRWQEALDERKKTKALNRTMEDESQIIKRIEKIFYLQAAIKIASEEDDDLKDFFAQLDNYICDKTSQAVLPDEMPINLIRKNNQGQYVPAYFNIDYLVDKRRYLFDLYTEKNGLHDRLAAQHNIIHFHSYHQETIEQEDATNSVKYEQLMISDEKFLEEMAEILKLEEEGKLTDEIIKTKIRNSKRNLKLLFERFQLLNKYVESKPLLDLLYEIRAKNIKKYRGVHNAIMFWAMDDTHPLKEAIFHHFEVGKVYSPQEIHKYMKSVIKLNLHSTMNHHRAINLFHSMVKSKRTRSDGYEVVGYNPLELPPAKVKIANNKYAANYLRL